MRVCCAAPAAHTRLACRQPHPARHAAARSSGRPAPDRRALPGERAGLAFPWCQADAFDHARAEVNRVRSPVSARIAAGPTGDSSSVQPRHISPHSLRHAALRGHRRTKGDPKVVRPESMSVRWMQRHHLRKADPMLDSTHNQSDPVAACTVDAVHRRDHHHGGEEACHPHLIEVVHLGRRAVAVCHDCRQDSGFLPERDADRLASFHRQETDGDEYSTFASWVA